MQAILRYDWPGNVRELRTAIEHGVVMSTGAKITLRDLPMPVRQGGSAPSASVSTYQVASQSKHFNLQANEHQLILQALDETGGNVTQAAKKLGISRRTLHRKLHELRAESQAPGAAPQLPPIIDPPSNGTTLLPDERP
jgi:DNA-binding NtrC family response regulator